ncbi:hypothetical protein ACFVIM_26910 [Streptomyces sp. NPDC057638]|uniref:hypothetical protein n=1 Tax=Streptomyces sp. NPDC057638 TaxID=3346190 RepID=UPI0036ACB9B9
MRRTSVRHAPVRRAAAVASALSLAVLLSACGGSDSSDEKKDEKKVDAAQPSQEGHEGHEGHADPAAKALTQPELEKLVVTKADLPRHLISNASLADMNAGKSAKADKPECGPLVGALALRGVGEPAATVTRKAVPIGADPAKDATAEEKALAGVNALKATVTSTTLASYDGKGASEQFAAVKKAGADCAGGFTLNAGADKMPFTKITNGSYTGGDESAAFTVHADMGGQPGQMHVVAVRKGTTLATFYAMSLGGTAEFPKQLIDTQVKKLG